MLFLILALISVPVLVFAFWVDYKLGKELAAKRSRGTTPNETPNELGAEKSDPGEYHIVLEREGFEAVREVLEAQPSLRHLFVPFEGGEAEFRHEVTLRFWAAIWNRAFPELVGSPRWGSHRGELLRSDEGGDPWSEQGMEYLSRLDWSSEWGPWERGGARQPSKAKSSARRDRITA